MALNVNTRGSENNFQLSLRQSENFLTYVRLICALFFSFSPLHDADKQVLFTSLS